MLVVQWTSRRGECVEQYSAAADGVELHGSASKWEARVDRSKDVLARKVVSRVAVVVRVDVHRHDAQLFRVLIAARNR